MLKLCYRVVLRIEMLNYNYYLGKTKIQSNNLYCLKQICIESLFGQNIMTFYFIGYHIYYLAFTQTFHTWSICVGGGGICFGIKSGFVVTLDRQTDFIRIDDSLQAIFICMQIGLLRHHSQVFLGLTFVSVRHYCVSLYEYHYQLKPIFMILRNTFIFSNGPLKCFVTLVIVFKKIKFVLSKT